VWHVTVKSAHETPLLAQSCSPGAGHAELLGDVNPQFLLEIQVAME
jgi:hypothetical protein